MYTVGIAAHAIFEQAEQFDEWFDLDIDDEEAKKNMISQLHKILRPFMLRRLKADVAKGLPPKTETILMVGMSKMQKKLYKDLLMRDLDQITGKVTGKNHTAVLNIVVSRPYRVSEFLQLSFLGNVSHPSLLVFNRCNCENVVDTHIYSKG